MEKSYLKIFEPILFIVSLLAIGFQLLSKFFVEFETSSGIVFFILIIMISIWIILLGNKELSTFEIVLFLYLLLSMGISSLLPLFGFQIFFLPFLVEAGISISVVFGILLLFVILFWFARIFKSSKIKENKITIYKFDIIIIVCAIITALIILAMYLLR